MKVYLVGGAVRDELLRLQVKEKDYVVVGASVEEMIKQGYLPVGKDFPVFLHPETKEEYALARTERKVGKGYKGFVFNASPEVTLEEDLRRRDLTINAIAKDGNSFIDPYNGQEDIKRKVLRHVSPAFSEDPVRILRVGRFAARFASLGFTVAKETTELMRQMVKAGEVDALVAERVWKEWERALSEKNPEKFFEVLEACGAMKVLFPYPLDVAMLEKAANKSFDAQVRFAALCHGLSEKELNELCDRYRVPGDYRDLAMLVVKYQEAYCRIKKSDAEGILNLLQSVDAFRREQRFEKFLLVCDLISHKKSDVRSDVKILLEADFAAAKHVSHNQDVQTFYWRAVDHKKLSGEEIKEDIRQRRIEAIKNRNDLQ